MASRLSAMDVEQQEFRRVMRGYDPEEVRLFLRSVAEQIERLTLDNGHLREETGHLRERLEDFRERERSLQETLMTAQQMAENMRDRTRQEADILMKEARLKAERLLEQAQDQLGRVEAEISRIRMERDAFESRLRSSLEEHLALLELRKKERGETENLRFLRRRSGTDLG
jgi:cell division initiation protein